MIIPNKLKPLYMTRFSDFSIGFSNFQIFGIEFRDIMSP